MNILKVLLLMQLHHAWALDASLAGWRLNVYKPPNRSIDEAIKEYFSTKTRLLSVALHLQYSRYWQIFINDYLTDVLKKSESMSFKIHMKNSHNQKNHQVFPYNLWYVDSYMSFRALLPDFGNHRGNDIGQYMIIMQTAWKLQGDKELLKIFETAFELNIVNIVVAVYDKNSIFLLYTYDIFKPGQCRQVIPRQINRFHNGNFDSQELFPYKFENFHKCPITVFLPYADPYYLFNLTKDGGRIDLTSGIEALLIDTLREHYNFDLRFYYKEFNFGGTVYKNGTATGPFQMLKEGHTDILLGCYHYMSRSQYFSGTDAYDMAPLVIIYHGTYHHYPFSSWIWKPFEKYVWLVIFIILSVAMVAARYLQYRYRMHKSFTNHLTSLDILGLALGNARPLNLRLYTSKYATVMWSLGFMIFCALYQGKLYDAFNRKPTTNPHTLQQLIDFNFTFLIRESVEKDIVASLNIPPDELQYLPIADDFEIYDKMLEYNGNVATMTNYREFQTYVSKTRLYAEFNLVSENVLTNQICAYLRQHSYLNEPITRLISYLSSGGIMMKWSNDEIILDTINTLKQIKEDNSDHEPEPLSWDKIYLVFLVLLLMYLVSILVFLGEIIAHKLASRKKCKLLNKNAVK